MSPKTCNACCHSPPLSQALTAELNVMPSVSTRLSAISHKNCTACLQFSPLSQALIATLYEKV
eukprot:CAMPEP_0203913708 /NCGR_PEP_ID=MMETSP0359-20131031/54677_1 /ASSEMBLY_ACC=CAM_ASM_000338 /TAXON_ID=268821 /ORGANISM="Scrippsiella Hangoei, Strain SHTV-5" /LENGTH=62 /DNA_ID=CAMNT_0050839897 /DNA_START=176 /DNA_END=361 /DNA_ORIENTATION=-